MKASTLETVRIVLLAIAGILLSIWAIHRFYTRKPEPMFVPVPAATEIPAPDLITMPEGSAVPRAASSSK